VVIVPINLRGMGEAGVFMSAPVHQFLGSFFFMLAAGLIETLTHLVYGATADLIHVGYADCSVRNIKHSSPITTWRSATRINPICH
jgi:hypothetical protein